MDIYKRILISSTLLILIVLLFAGCKSTNVKKEDGFSNNINFPTKNNGYPNPEFILINGEQYELKNFSKAFNNKEIEHEIELESIKLDEEISIVLSRVMPISIWTIDENIYTNLISYFSFENPIRKENIVEGESNILQKFDIQLSKEKFQEIKFKWINVNELGKSFDETTVNYSLSIKIVNE